MAVPARAVVAAATASRRPLPEVSSLPVNADAMMTYNLETLKYATTLNKMQEFSSNYCKYVPHQRSYACTLPIRSVKRRNGIVWRRALSKAWKVTRKYQFMYIKYDVQFSTFRNWTVSCHSPLVPDMAQNLDLSTRTFLKYAHFKTASDFGWNLKINQLYMRALK